jgi:outer membrane protein
MNRRFKQLRRLIPGLMILAALNATAQQESPASSAQVSAPGIHSLSLKEAIDYAAKNSVYVKNALLDIRIQEQSNRATTSQALPQLTGSVGFTDYLQIPTTLVPADFIPGGTPGTYQAFKFGTQYNTNAGATLKQVLFDGQVFVGLAARQASLDFYAKKQEITEQMLRVNIYKIYYQLLLSQTQVAQSDANITKQKDLLHSSSEMFKNGFSEKLDVDKANVQLANLESDRLPGIEDFTGHAHQGLPGADGHPHL